ncbi:MAG: nitrous oxide reductase family maturation protein NosD [Planctomycetota bacterium]
MRRTTATAICAFVLGFGARACAQSAGAASEHEAPLARGEFQAGAPLGRIGRAIAEAAAGATVEIAPGVYREHIRIEKSITLIGRGRPVIDGGGEGDIIEITAPDVTVRGFSIRNTGVDLDKENVAVRVLAPRAVIEDNELEDILFGIDLREAADSVIRGNRIGGKRLDIARRGDGLRLWRSNGTLIEANTIHDGRDSIMWYSSHVLVRGNRSEDCRYGLHLMFSDEITIEDNVLTGNSVGIYAMYSAGITMRRNQLIRNRGPSGYGLGLKEADRFTVRENLFTQNRVGVYVDGSPFTTTQPGVFERNMLAYNDVGFMFLPSARGNEITENNFIDNLDQVCVAGRGRLDANRFWKGERGNYWSDYTGYDQNRDGVGDFVQEAQTLFDNLMEREPKLRLFLFSPAQQAIEFLGRVLPAVRPEPKFTDEVPLMEPIVVDLGVNAGAEARPGSLLATGLLLALIGGVTIGCVRVPKRKVRAADGAPSARERMAA